MIHKIDERMSKDKRETCWEKRQSGMKEEIGR